MEKVTGIGGLFFRSKEPEKLASWYEKNLGITLTPTSKVSVDEHDYPNGRFARLHDPEGNPIELWEAKVPK
jgi:glyoxylase I family protein